ncbi:ABC transporter permease [Gymnodinialimonas sp. 2305UL16-5]|uniref:ABC transporter permease n=1 Tax=Gymnodinialimonas mytili TaxID=3126503 RepID=UPI0030A1B6BA
MLTYTIRRLILAIPTLLFISFVIFLIVKLSPSDPTAGLPLTIPPEVREQIRESLGVNQPVLIQYIRWLQLMMWNEPLHLIEGWTGWEVGPEGPRIISYQTRSPVMDLIMQRMPQTLWVVGTSYIVGILIALPLGIISAYKQYSIFDQLGTFISMLGFSVPTFFTGVLFIVIFAVNLGWFPSVYDTTHQVTDWDSFVVQFRQMIMPVMVLGLFNASQISRYMRASMLDNLNQDYVRTARAKGLGESTVVLVHVLRNSMIPVVTVIALNVPAVFGGAIITEQVFKVNGIGQLLIIAIQAGDVPVVQTVSFIFAVLIVLFNLLADILYGILDPRIRYD